MMGFDPDEVMEFLRLCAEELESLIKERNSLRETLREKELAIAEYRERDELLKSTQPGLDGRLLGPAQDGLTVFNSQICIVRKRVVGSPGGLG